MCMCVYVPICKCACVYVHYVYVHVYMYMYVYVHVCICACMLHRKTPLNSLLEMFKILDPMETYVFCPFSCLPACCELFGVSGGAPQVQFGFDLPERIKKIVGRGNFPLLLPLASLLCTPGLGRVDRGYPRYFPPCSFRR